MLGIPDSLSFLCLARKPGKVFSDFHAHPTVLRLCGDPPYYLMRVTLAPEGAYWGWWSPGGGSGQGIPIHFINSHRQGVEICFAYGSKVEEDLDRGRIVRCDVEAIRTLTAEECSFDPQKQVEELGPRT